MVWFNAAYIIRGVARGHPGTEGGEAGHTLLGMEIQLGFLNTSHGFGHTALYRFGFSQKDIGNTIGYIQCLRSSIVS